MVDINLTSNSGSGVKETDFDQIKDLVQDGGVEPTSSSPLVTKTGTQTLSGKTLTAPTVSATSASAGTAMKYQSGTVMTVPEAGAVEYDGTCHYLTHTGSARGVDLSEQFIALTSTYTLTSTTSTQKLFNVPANGALTVKAATSYFFECDFSLSSMSATSGNTKFDVLGAGTATLTSVAWSAIGLDATTPGTAAAVGGSFTATNISSGDIVTAGTGTAMFARIQGIIRINASGTIIPSVALTTANAAIVGVNSFFRIRPIGSNTVASVGNWS